MRAAILVFFLGATILAVEGCLGGESLGPLDIVFAVFVFSAPTLMAGLTSLGCADWLAVPLGVLGFLSYPILAGIPIVVGSFRAFAICGVCFIGLLLLSVRGCEEMRQEIEILPRPIASGARPSHGHAEI